MPTPTPLPNDADILSFARFLLKGIKKFGIKRVEKKLQELSITPCNNDLRNKILEEVSTAYELTPYIITHSEKRGKITQAKVMAMILFQIHLQIIQKDIAMFFGKKQSLVSRRITIFQKVKMEQQKINGTKMLNSDIPYQKVYTNGFMEKYDFVNNKINLYKNQCQKD